ncbi:cardiolipin synthase [Nocardioides lianchengensis]|uniref:Cardiolipin synthase n=1 Tax=Nocardioides lianchengensis TaxID=1045774 RepID=A0A1G6W1I1_9ACTN|nr:cardiolipin synthase [Nocardioides lianchengensis]NYG09473.1 cardiolipin synthase [Nocardioides lianchengensis]SDD59742.1 cardiolipin synthase [Nocardioides lianchengensis]
MDAGWLVAALGAAAALLHAAVCVVALGVLPAGRKPSTAMAWLILVLAVPFLGVVAFLLVGSTSVGRRRRTWQREVNDRVLAAVPAQPVVREPPPGEVAGMAELNRRLGAFPMSHDNTVEVLPDYQGSIDAMRREVERAERFVHVEFYIAAWDEATDGFFEALRAAVARGVEVRLLFDHLGSRGVPGYRDLLRRLQDAGIRHAPMLRIDPLRGQVRRPDLRNHRKILVVDGRVGFIGSQNLIEPGYDDPGNHRRGLTYRELVARVSGPAVRQLAVVFATDWVAETGEPVSHTLGPAAPDPFASGVPGVAAQVVPSGPGFATENNLRLFNSMLYAARSRISLTSPYFVPDETLLYAVTTAAQRGVEVELFVSAVADQFMVAHAQRSYYGALLDVGVRIWLYPAPYVLHAKFLTVDDDLAVIGSSNLDYRSFALNYECVLFARSTALVEGLGVVQDGYRAASTELTAEQWHGRGWWTAYVDNVMRLTAALQ